MDRRPAIASFCGFSGSGIAVIALQILRPERSMLHSFVSEFAVGRFGFVMTDVFVVLAVSSQLLEAAMRQTRISAPRIFVFIRLTVVGLLVMATCRTDLNDGSPRTLIGSIHNIDAVFTFVAVLAVMRSIAYMPEIGLPLVRLQPESRCLAAFCSVTLTIMLSLIGIQHAHRPYLYAGLPERVMIVGFLLWACLVSFALSQFCDEVNHGKTR